MPAPAATLRTRYELSELGSVAEEYLLSGEARAFIASTQSQCDERPEAASIAPYRTRIVVFRPIDLDRFSGTVVVEWLNCHIGMDTPPQWLRMHRHIARSGMIWVGVSAQQAGIDGIAGTASHRHLKAVDFERYRALQHPGDAYAFDIFTDAARQVAAGKLSFRAPDCTLATGSSLSARFLSTYINQISEAQDVFGGFLLTGRHKSAATLAGQSICGGTVAITAKTNAPVFVLQSETDIFGRMSSYAIRQPDTSTYRLWETASAAHVDSYMIGVGNEDNGQARPDRLVASYALHELSHIPLCQAMNSSPAFHYVHHAALHHLQAWVTDGTPPPRAQRLEGKPLTGLARDSWGIARGGVRTAWSDCPSLVWSGDNAETGEAERLFGATRVSRAMLAARYPGGERDYIAQFDKTARHSIEAGFMLEADASEARELAGAIFRKASTGHW